MTILFVYKGKEEEEEEEDEEKEEDEEEEHFAQLQCLLFPLLCESFGVRLDPWAPARGPWVTLCLSRVFGML